MLIGLYIITWALSFAAAAIWGDRTGRRTDAMWLTGILGLLGLAVFAAVLALDAPQGRAPGR